MPTNFRLDSPGQDHSGCRMIRSVLYTSPSRINQTFREQEAPQWQGDTGELVYGGLPQMKPPVFLLDMCDDSRCGWYSEVIIWHLQYTMPSESQSSVYKELAQSRFLCKTLHSLQRAFFNLHRAFFSFLSEIELQKSQFGVVIIPPSYRWGMGGDLGTCAKTLVDHRARVTNQVI